MASVDLIVVPYDSGRRGWRMGAGPDALLAAGRFEGGLRETGHDVAIRRMDSASADPLGSAVEHAVLVAESVRRSRAAGRFPVVLAGNCIATVGAFAGARGPDTGVAWLDAHADLNTPATSPSGFLDGMAAATLLGWCFADAFADVPGHRPLAADHLVLIGGRSFDPSEADVIARGTVSLLSPADAHDDAVVAARLRDFARSTGGVYIHLDLDVLDPVACGPANEFATPDGLTIDGAERCMRALAAAKPLVGISVTAYDPVVDVSGAVGDAAARLVRAAVECAA